MHIPNFSGCSRSKWLAAILLASGFCLAQVDPGPRPGPAGAGGPFPTLNANEKAFFNASLAAFNEVDSVSGTLPGEPGVGLGPSFNGNSCVMCHAQPAPGGSSPAPFSPQVPVPNPQVALATLHGATNTVPPFITVNGPVREARFIAQDPTSLHSALDGGVHGLYTIKGRVDAPGCNLAQPNFAFQLANANVSFRIPTPAFGMGLVENTPDSALQANLNANAAQKAALGIGGRLNMTGNDGSVTRFGWKAQNKSLNVFAGEAYNVEQGVSNEVFDNERSAVPGCVFNATPEDHTIIGAGGVGGAGGRGGARPRRQLRRLHASDGAARAHGEHGVAVERPVSVLGHRVQSLPQHFTDDGCVAVHRHGQCHLSPVLRFRGAPHGRGPARRHRPGDGRAR